MLTTMLICDPFDFLPVCDSAFTLLSFHTTLGVFSLGVPVDDLFFIGNQLVATSHTGKVGVWNAVTQHWQVGGRECGSPS